MAGNKSDLREIIAKSLREGTLPDLDTLRKTMQDYPSLDESDLNSIVAECQSEIDNEKKEFQNYFDIEVQSLDHQYSQLEVMLEKGITPGLVDFLQEFRRQIDESDRRYAHLENDALLNDVWKHYAGDLDAFKSRARQTESRAVKSANSSLDTLLWMYKETEISTENLAAIERIRKEAEEKKEVLARFGADTKPAASILGSIDLSIEYLKAKIIEEKEKEQDRTNKRDELYGRFENLRDRYFDNTDANSRKKVLAAALRTYHELNSLGDSRAGEINIFAASIEDDIKRTEQEKSKRRRGLMKTASGLLALGFFAYAGARLGSQSVDYVSHLISSTRASTAAMNTATGVEDDYSGTAEQTAAAIQSKRESPDPAPVYFQQPQAIEQPKLQLSREEKMLSSIAETYSNMRYIVYVDKEENMTHLYEIISGRIKLNPVFSWRSTDGKGGFGPKQEAGDQRTPEGIYQIDRITWMKKHMPLYGPVAIRLNYPNNIDTSLGRTGGGEGKGILICGTYIDERLRAIQYSNDSTNGAVVLRPNEAEQLANQIENHSGQTLVVIEGMTRINGDYIRRFNLE